MQDYQGLYNLKTTTCFFFQSFKLVEVKERGLVVGMEYLSFYGRYVQGASLLRSYTTGNHTDQVSITANI